MDERLRLVARFLDGEKMAAVCREFGISHKTGYKIFNRYKVIGQQVEEFFGQSLVLESIIHRYVGVAEATAMKKGVVENTAATSATFDFTKLFNELKEEMDYEQERHAAAESINR